VTEKRIFSEIIIKIASQMHLIVIIALVSIFIIMDLKLLSGYCVGKVAGPIKSGWLKFYFD